MPDKKLTDAEIKKALKEILELMCCEGDLQRSATISHAIDLINRLQARVKKCETVEHFADKTIATLQAEVERLNLDIAELEAKNFVKDKLLAKAEAKIEGLQMDNEQLHSDIVNARMNLEHIRKLYEERADLCEEQDRQLLELDFILANYPYMVHFGNGTMCTENHKEYEKLLASISANAVNVVLEELKTTLIINNEGNTEFFDYDYTLETIEELKIKR